MINIACCDDDASMLNKMHTLLRQNRFLLEHQDYEVRLFTDPMDFIKDNEKTPFQLVFLDIEMPVVDGFELAQEIIKETANHEIIFVSSHEHLVFQSFNFRPFRFVRKSRLEEELPIAFEAYINQYCQLGACEFNVNSGIRKVAANQILYLEVFNHELEVVAASTRFTCRDYLARWEGPLLELGFIKPNRSSLVNPEYVSDFKDDIIYFVNGDKIFTSHRKRSKIQEELDLYNKRKKSEFC